MSRFLWKARVIAPLCTVALGPAISARAVDPPAAGDSGMSHMSGHMYMTTLRAIQPGDKQKADAVVAAAKIAMAPY
ncbi:MAG TPA: hypothetical protein VK670_11115, partial [Silvibacterium sp.]|nr:hypothetical protein [Silvibacterium sp.]